MDEKLLEYAEISQQMKKLEARKKVLQEEIESELGQSEVDVKKDFGTFKMVARTNWEYTPEVYEAEEDLKIRKKDEQETGVAKETIVYGLRFNPAKE